MVSARAGKRLESTLQVSTTRRGRSTSSRASAFCSVSASHLGRKQRLPLLRRLSAICSVGAHSLQTTTPRKLNDQSLYNILLLLAILLTYAVDTSICERGFALMNNLKTGRRSLMGNLLLRTLMTICELGKEWEDPSKIPVEDIVQEWREQSSKGRYESAMWRAAGLVEPNSKGASGAVAGGGEVERGEQVDNTTAGGFFQRFGRERDAPRARVIPPPPARATTSPADQTTGTLDSDSSPSPDSDSDSDSSL